MEKHVIGNRYHEIILNGKKYVVPAEKLSEIETTLEGDDVIIVNSEDAAFNGSKNQQLINE